MSYSLSHLSDSVLLHDLNALVARDRATTAALLAHLAEIDTRKLYLPAAYPSMFAWCVGELHLGEQAAFKRIHAARTARRFPAIFVALAEGRLHLSAITLLAPYLRDETVKDLLAAAAHKSKSEVERFLAERFPRSEMLPMVQTLSAPGALGAEQLSPGRVQQLAPGRIEAPRSKVAPLAPQRFALQVTMSRSTHDKLRYAQELLSHQVASGDIAEALDRVLDIAIRQLEKRKFAATPNPRPPQGLSSNPRTIPAHVMRAVWKRDGRKCTFVSSAGRRCSARTQLEFDHVDEVARGGHATVEGIRLRCRAHNQYGAECTFGAELMSRKRQEARAAAAARAAAKARSAAAKERAKEVIPWLQRLGIRAEDARRAAALCEAIPDAPIEGRVRRALSYFGPRTSPRGRVASVPAASGP